MVYSLVPCVRSNDTNDAAGGKFGYNSIIWQGGWGIKDARRALRRWLARTRTNTDEHGLTRTDGCGRDGDLMSPVRSRRQRCAAAMEDRAKNAGGTPAIPGEDARGDGGPCQECGRDARDPRRRRARRRRAMPPGAEALLAVAETEWCRCASKVESQLFTVDLPPCPVVESNCRFH